MSLYSHSVKEYDKLIRLIYYHITPEASIFRHLFPNSSKTAEAQTFREVCPWRVDGFWIKKKIRSQSFVCQKNRLMLHLSHFSIDPFVVLLIKTYSFNPKCIFYHNKISFPLQNEFKIHILIRYLWIKVTMSVCLFILEVW